MFLTLAGIIYFLVVYQIFRMADAQTIAIGVCTVAVPFGTFLGSTAQSNPQSLPTAHIMHFSAHFSRTRSQR